MSGQPRKILREFYDQALLSPELLCLNCGNSDWCMGHGQCSDSKRHDCLLFVTDMVECLARNDQAPKSAGSRPSPSLP